MKEIIILKNTKTGLVADSVIVSESKDTISIAVDLSGNSVLEIPDKTIKIQTEGKDWFDYSLGIITILGAILAAVYTWKSLKKLFEKDEDKQMQINKLANIAEKMQVQNDILEKANQLTSRQIDVLSSISFKNNTPTNETAESKASLKALGELAMIEKERMELEHIPRLFCNSGMGSFNSMKYKIENGGKPITINELSSENESILLKSRLPEDGFFMPENGKLEFSVESKDGQSLNRNKPIVIIICTDQLKNKYQINFDTNSFESIRRAIKLEE